LRTGYGQSGLLVPVSVLVLVAGGYIQHVRSELPSAYTWWQPFDTLKMIVQLEGFPMAVVVAYLLGASARLGPSGLRDLFTAARALELSPERRAPLLLRVLFGVVLTALDVIFLPGHGPLDAIAVGVAGGLLAKPYSRETWRRFVLHTACAILVFTAVCYWFTVVKALTFVGSKQRDPDILAFEHALTGIYPHRWVAAWASERPTWVGWFDWAYLKIFDHMAVTTAFLLGLRDLRQRTEYLGALAICYLLGAPLYLLCPAAGPAYFDPAQFMFLRHQQLSVNYVQAMLYHNTAAVNDGRSRVLSTWSYIACMPSLHMAHESVMLFYVRASKPALALSIAFISLTGVAVVALGWHYPSDILGGFGLALFAIVVARWQSKRLLPRFIASE
jgi:membrane-associated phospholipid phosphatase